LLRTNSNSKRNNRINSNGIVISEALLITMEGFTEEGKIANPRSA
jgi:hypothetical protein